MFWSGIWSESKECNRNVEWLTKFKEENNYQKQECLVFTEDIVSKESRKISNGKAPGRDEVLGF